MREADNRQTDDNMAVLTMPNIPQTLTSSQIVQTHRIMIELSQGGNLAEIAYRERIHPSVVTQRIALYGLRVAWMAQLRNTPLDVVHHAMAICDSLQNPTSPRHVDTALWLAQVDAATKHQQARLDALMATTYGTLPYLDPAGPQVDIVTGPWRLQ